MVIKGCNALVANFAVVRPGGLVDETPSARAVPITSLLCSASLIRCVAGGAVRVHDDVSEVCVRSVRAGRRRFRAITSAAIVIYFIEKKEVHGSLPLEESEKHNAYLDPHRAELSSDAPQVDAVGQHSVPLGVVDWIAVGSEYRVEPK